MPDRPWPEEDESDPSILVHARYVIAAGEVVAAWNALQEELGGVFAAVTGLTEQMAGAIWHSVRSDSLQRQMLLAALCAAPESMWCGELASAKDELCSLVRYLNTLSEDRNNAIHAPIGLTSHDGETMVLFPIENSGNPRSKRLRGKDIIAEFRRCRDAANELWEFTFFAARALKWPTSAPWPDRPAQLGPPPKRSRASNPGRQSRKARHRDPPLSSQA